jgi:hypothetical protein
VSAIGFIAGCAVGIVVEDRFRGRELPLVAVATVIATTLAVAGIAWGVSWWSRNARRAMEVRREASRRQAAHRMSIGSAARRS